MDLLNIGRKIPYRIAVFQLPERIGETLDVVVRSLDPEKLAYRIAGFKPQWLLQRQLHDERFKSGVLECLQSMQKIGGQLRAWHHLGKDLRDMQPGNHRLLCEYLLTAHQHQALGLSGAGHAAAGLRVFFDDAHFLSRLGEATTDNQRVVTSACNYDIISSGHDRPRELSEWKLPVRLVPSDAPSALKR